MTRGLFVGRFQPIHKGHLSALAEASKQVDELIIGIGSANVSHTFNDPFTAGERFLMVLRSLQEHSILNFHIIPIPDVNRYAIWVSHVLSLIPPIDIVFTNAKLTRTLFQEAGYSVKSTERYTRDIFKAAKVRELMLHGGDWEQRVPSACVKIIKKMELHKRFEELYG